MIRGKEQLALEKLIDENDVESVLEAIATICYLKADHIRENWQDANLANKWTQAARVIAKCSATSSITGMS